MSSPIRLAVEGRLAFEFDRATWDAVKWDDDAAYREGLRRSGASAVDILATMHRSDVCLFEVKDSRGSSIEYRNKITSERLAEIVANKVRDTIAGVVYARDRHPGEHLLVHLKSLFQERASRPLVILWWEDHELEPAQAMSLTGLIEKRLTWLKPKVLVTSRTLWRGRAGLTVRSLAGAPWQG